MPNLRHLTFAFLLVNSYPLMAQASPNPASGYQATYDRFLQQIRQIAIFDDHGHPGFADDSDVDAMASPPLHASLRLRIDNPEFVAASRALFEYPYSDFSAEHMQWLVQKKAALRKTYPGYQYFDRILDQLNVQTMMANRVALGDYLDPRRFRWVFFVDSFLFPLHNSELTARNVDESVYIPLQEKKLQRELTQAGLSSLPATLPAYLEFVTRILEQNRARGGVAIKFEIAYFRTLHFEDPTQAAAEKVYATYRAAGEPTAAEHAVLEDYLFRYLLREAGRLHLPGANPHGGRDGGLL